MILGATILLQTDYAFINRKAVRYLQIDYDRDLYCKPKIAIDKKSGKPIYKNGHTIISGINTFFQDEDVSKENTLNIDKHPANIKSINESAKNSKYIITRQDLEANYIHQKTKNK